MSDATIKRYRRHLGRVSSTDYFLPSTLQPFWTAERPVVLFKGATGPRHLRDYLREFANAYLEELPDGFGPAWLADGDIEGDWRAEAFAMAGADLIEQVLGPPPTSPGSLQLLQRFDALLGTNVRIRALSALWPDDSPLVRQFFALAAVHANDVYPVSADWEEVKSRAVLGAAVEDLLPNPGMNPDFEDLTGRLFAAIEEGALLALITHDIANRERVLQGIEKAGAEEAGKAARDRAAYEARQAELEAQAAERRRQRRAVEEARRAEEAQRKEANRQALAEAMAAVVKAKDPQDKTGALHAYRRLAVELGDEDGAAWAKAQLKHLRS